MSDRSPNLLNLVKEAATSWVSISLVLSATILVARSWWHGRPEGEPTDAAAYAAMVRHDPPIGTHITTGIQSNARYRILICTTMCGCDKPNLTRLRAESEPPGVITRLVVPGTEASLDEKPGLSQFKEHFYFDPKYSLIGRLNSMWMPRVFVLDSQDRLVWKSEHFGEEWPVLRTEALKFIAKEGSN